MQTKEKTSKVSPQAKELANLMLNDYFTNQELTYDDLTMNLKRMSYLAKQSSEWDNEKDSKTIKLIDDIVISSFLIFN